MKLIIPPLNFGDRGDAVGNLQDALLLLLDKGVIQTSEEERRFLTELLCRERGRLVFDEGTKKAVSLLQEQRRLELNGSVDEPTAEALNKFLRELRAITEPQQFVVRGRVTSDGFPVPGITVLAADMVLRRTQAFDTAHGKKRISPSHCNENSLLRNQAMLQYMAQEANYPSHALMSLLGNQPDFNIGKVQYYATLKHPDVQGIAEDMKRASLSN